VTACVVRAKDYDEALALANDTEFGLAAGICTTSLKYAPHFKRNSEAGMVMVNLRLRASTITCPSAGDTDRSANTTPGNKKGGLTNIVEKSLGSIVKSGTSPIVDVLSPGERVRKKGMTFAATPASDFICGTLQFASGMTLQVFTTGRGTPYGLAAAPVIKVSTRTELARRWKDLIDFDAGRIATGEATVEETGWDLFRLILEVASGRTKVRSDRRGIHNDLTRFTPGP
jgi:galactarate dehydratase